MLSHTTSSIFASFPYLAVVREIRYRLVAILNKRAGSSSRGDSQAGQMYTRAKEGAAKATPANLKHKGLGLIRPGFSLFVLSVSENLINRELGFRESRIRNCLENSWIGLDRVFSVSRSVDKGALRPVLPTRRRPRVEPIRIYQTVSLGN